MDEAAKTVGSIVPLVRDFVSWLVARHREDKKRRLLAQEALGKHPILDDSCLPDYPNPPWPTILGKYGDCRGKGALRTWFADMSFAGNEGSRGSVVLLFLWIIAQSHPGTDSNGIHRLLSEVVKSGSERISDKKIDLHDNDFFKKPVKALAKSMQKCPLPDVLVKDLEDLLVNNPTNYKTLQSDFRQSFPRKRPLGFAAGPNAAGSSFAPSLLFNKQGSVIIPCDADAGKLILWATLKLGLGSLVKNESEFDPDRLWNVFYFNQDPAPSYDSTMQYDAEATNSGGRSDFQGQEKTSSFSTNSKGRTGLDELGATNSRYRRENNDPPVALPIRGGSDQEKSSFWKTVKQTRTRKK